ncbi:hypothetical protein niasHS_012320 [Heterodera schachtii]|uniref:Uncharacterized protein n=1 Tax=Heterodera schachtii TaxID=97005 RepID=A0ABD2IJ69_HETSC
MELLSFFLFCASFFCAPLGQVKAVSKKGPVFDVSPPRDRPSDQPSLIDLLQEGPPSMYQTQSQHSRGSSALPHFGATANPTLSSEFLNWETPPENVPSLMDDNDSFGTNGQPPSEATNPFASHPSGKQSAKERAAETASSESANVTSSSSTQEDSSHSRRSTVDITKSRRTRRPSIAENEPIAKQLNELAIQEESLNAASVAAAANMSREPLHINPQASGQTNYQNPNLQLIGQTNKQKPINPQVSGQPNKQKSIMAQSTGQTSYQIPIMAQQISQTNDQKPIIAQMSGQINYQNPPPIGQPYYQNPNPQQIGQPYYHNQINHQQIGQTNCTPNECYYQNQAEIPTYNLTAEVLGLNMLSSGDTPQNQAPQMANAPESVANSTESVQLNKKKTASKPSKKKDSQNAFADNQMLTQYPKVPISKWTNHRLPVHPKKLRAKGQFDVKKKFPKATSGLDKIEEFMDDTGEWIKIEVKQGKAVAIYLRDLSGNQLQIEEPLDLTFGGEKRFLRTNGTEILYPAKIIYSWTKYQFPVHPEELKAGGQLDVKEKYPTETNGLDKIVEFMDDTGEWIRIEAKQENSVFWTVINNFCWPTDAIDDVRIKGEQKKARCQPTNMYKNSSETPKMDSKTASAKRHEKRRRLPHEIIFELVLCVPSTELEARRLLLTCSLIYRLISSSKKTQNWRKPVPILKVDDGLFFTKLTSFRVLPLLPRRHSDSLLFETIMSARFDDYFLTIHHHKCNPDNCTTVDGVKSFMALITIDAEQLPPNRTARMAKDALKISLEANQILSSLCSIHYYNFTDNVPAERLRLNFSATLSDQEVKQKLFFVIGLRTTKFSR